MVRFLADLPIFGLFVGTLLLVLASGEAGYRWAKKRRARRELEKEAPIGAMVGAVLGLLAFLLAFTFGIAADAYHATKVALVQEANAIRMTYLLTDAIPEAHRAEIRIVLRQYVDERLRCANGQPDESDASARALLDRLWKTAAIVGAQNPGGVDVFLGYVGKVIELQQERLMLRERSRIPAAFWVVVYTLALLALSAMGYHSGVVETSRSPVILAVAIAFSAVIMVIGNLDRPGQGFINVSQQAMLELRATLAESKR
jgi:hypothetical protein